MNYVNAVSAHPEPQFARENFVSLDGEWQVALNGGAPRTVRVPYCIESELSGIGEKALITDLVYTRTFRLPEAMRGGRVFLHFGGGRPHRRSVRQRVARRQAFRRLYPLRV